MNPLNRLSIRARLWATCGLLLVLLAAVAATSGFGMVVAQKGLAGMTELAIPVRTAHQKAQMSLLRARVLEAEMVANNLNTEAISGLRKQWDAQQQQVDGSLDAMAALLAQPKYRQALDDYRKALTQYRSAFEPSYKKLLGSQYPDSAEAFEDMAPANRAFAAADTISRRFEGESETYANAVTERISGIVQQSLVATAALFGIAMVLGLAVATHTNRSIARSFASARRVAGQIASGDLSGSIDTRGRDEAAQLLQSLDTMQQSLRRLVGDVRTTSDSIRTASAEVACGNQELSTRTEQAASHLQQTTSSMEQLTGAVKQSADSARTASQLASSAADVASRGGAVVSEVVATMNQIQSSSRQIAEIIGTIDGIAFQTNILALNAAVEAARAGEQGRGFAVVASEVRSLASRSADAAKQIKSLIGASVEKVDTGSRLVANAGQTMDEIVSSVQRVNDMISEITAAANEQSSGIGSVNASVSELDAMTQQNAALVEESAAAAESLKQQAAHLNEVVGSFKLQASTQPAAALYGTPEAQARPSIVSGRPTPAEPQPKAPPPAPKAAGPSPVVTAKTSVDPALSARPTPPAKASTAAEDDWASF